MAKTSAVMGIEIQKGVVRIALLDSGSKKVLRTSSYDVGEDPLTHPQILEDLLKGAESELPIPPTERVLALPRTQCVLRIAEIPAEVSEIDDHIRWELQTVLNSEVDEYYFSYDVLGTNESETGDVAVIAGIRKPLLDDFCSKFSASSHFPKIVEIDSLAVVNALEMAMPEAFHGHTLLMKADYTEVTMMRIFQGKIVQIQALPLRSFQPGLPEDSREKLIQKLSGDLKKEFQAFADIENLDPAVIVCGGLYGEKGFAEKIAEDHSDWQFVPMDTYDKLTLSAEGNMLATVPVFAGAIGAALRRVGDKK